jgi:hypothetical protein
VARPFSRAGEGRASDDEGAFGREDGEEAVVGCVENLVAEEVVVVVFLGTAVVGGVWGDGVDIEGTLDVVNYVWWVLNRSDARSRSCANASWG